MANGNGKVEIKRSTLALLALLLSFTVFVSATAVKWGGIMANATVIAESKAENKAKNEFQDGRLARNEIDVASLLAEVEALKSNQAFIRAGVEKLLEERRTR